MAATYALLEGPALAEHLNGVPAVAARLGGRPGDWRVREIGDGNVNYVFEVRGPAGRICVKQAMPYVRVVGESWPLTPRRTYYEYRALQEHGRLVAARVPEVLGYDPERNLLALEHLAPHVVLRHGLLHGVRYPRLARQLAEYLAGSMFGTSDLARPAVEKRRLATLFGGNTEMTQIMEDMVFTETYREHWRNSWTHPQLDAAADRLRSDTGLKIAASRLKLRYLTCAQALLHGDLHTGSILVTEDDTRVIDQEFACFGPMGFDLGTLLAHLLIGHLARAGHQPADAERNEYQEWILEVIEELWHGFSRRFLQLWERSADGDAYPRALFAHPADLDTERRRYVDQVWADTLGFCGTEILRRIFGLAHVVELQSIPDDDIRAACELRCVSLATDLLTRPTAYPTVEAVTSAARSV
ncbi:S-methyl-5-thioribose kinase [Planomonospora sp. ID67723]|uniref:S-methyl-5-thioribose kinase n=1 Tax=Planomonospora sp. ID67723 TaxID=2738134 RepID=UPI0018C40BA0|nr:S-methyl-5-thioribose kinase [Planomonospora sp. ID67723]MBG0831329.1 S-methyl-5-thioribose kinase [Planomonospora sp. ID67723]